MTKANISEGVVDSSIIELMSALTINNRGDPGSFQVVAADLNVLPGVGTSVAGDSDFIAAIMGNLIGATLTKTKNYLAGVIGALSVTGVKSTTYPVGGVLGIISDAVTAADGALVAVIDGDSALTKANAAFKAMSNNSVPGSGFDFGLDLTSPGHDGFSDLVILKADIRMSNDVVMFSGTGIPTDGPSGTGAGFAGPGSIYCRRLNGSGAIFFNAGTKASPFWGLA